MRKKFNIILKKNNIICNTTFSKVYNTKLLHRII